LDPEAGALANFAADLRRLRKAAGNPPYRELAGRAHYSWSTLADAAAGRKLPSLPVTLAYVRACGGDPERWEQRWRAMAADLADPSPSQPDDPDVNERCPYVGLRPFQAEDADDFFGREQLTDDLISRVRASRFLAVFGASGSGKSSLLRAGLTPRVHSEDHWPYLLFTPGSHPVEECSAQLSAWAGRSVTELHHDLSADPRSLHLTVLQALHDQPREIGLLLVVDQFEEVFTLCADCAERAAFLSLLLTAAQAVNSRVRVVLGVRADFYPHCSRYPELVSALRDAQLLVGPMTTEELRRAISNPAARVRCAVEGALLARVVADASGQASNALPLISHALQQSWGRRRGNTLTLAGYEAVGGIQHALAHTAEKVYAELAPDQQRLVRGVFLRLVALGDGTEDTRRRVGREEFSPGLDAVLDALATARLISVDSRTVEIAHEALLHAWPRLHEWIEQDRAGLRVYQEIAADATAWQRDRRDSSVLYRGSRLTTAQEWAGRHPEIIATNPRTAEFMHASVRRERRARWQRMAVVAVLCALLLAATGSVVVAIQQSNTAQAKSNGLAGAQTSAEAHQMTGTNVSLAAQLDLVSYRSQPTPQAYTDLLSTENEALSTPLTGHTGAVYAVAFSPDGRTLATTSRDGSLRLWNLKNRAHPVPWGPAVAGHAGRIYWVAFSPDGRTVATANSDGTIRLWNVTSRAHPVAWGRPLTGHSGYVNSVAFSPDGRLLVSAGADQTVRLWDVANPAHASALGRPLTGSTGPVNLARFSPDGHLVASADQSGLVRLWNVANPAHPALLGVPISADSQHAYAVAFSPDGGLLATGGDDHTVRLWRLTDPAHPAPVGQPMTGHTNTVFAVAFNSAGTVLASAGADRTVRLWNVTDPAHPVAVGSPLVGHTGYIYSLAFSPDGQLLATADADHTARIWSLPGTVLLGHTGRVLGVAFSPNGKVLASGSADHTVRLWDVSDPAHPRPLGRPLTGHTGEVRRVAFSPDGRTLASASADGTVRLWNVTHPAHPAPLGRPLQGHTGTVEIAVFSPDGRVLATAGADKTVRLWDVTNPARPLPLGQPLTGHSDFVFWLAFSSDGRMLASVGADDKAVLWNVSEPEHARELLSLPLDTSGAFGVAFGPRERTLAVAGSDSTVRLWDLTNLAHPRPKGSPLTGHTSFVYWVGYSPDGKSLASASGDGTVRLWDVADPAPPTALGQLTGHTAAIDNAAFSPNGRVLASASDDHTIQLTTLDVNQARLRICGATAGTLTAAQWHRYVPGLPFDPPCSRITELTNGGYTR
jgi:WD40 repeat protein